MVPDSETTVLLAIRLYLAFAGFSVTHRPVEFHQEIVSAMTLFTLSGDPDFTVTSTCLHRETKHPLLREFFGKPRRMSHGTVSLMVRPDGKAIKLKLNNRTIVSTDEDGDKKTTSPYNVAHFANWAIGDREEVARHYLALTSHLQPQEA